MERERRRGAEGTRYAISPITDTILDYQPCGIHVFTLLFIPTLYFGFVKGQFGPLNATVLLVTQGMGTGGY